MYGEILTSMESGSKDSKNTKERNSQKVGEMRGSFLLLLLLFFFRLFYHDYLLSSASLLLLLLLSLLWLPRWKAEKRGLQYWNEMARRKPKRNHEAYMKLGFPKECESRSRWIRSMRIRYLATAFLQTDLFLVYFFFAKERQFRCIDVS